MEDDEVAPLRAIHLSAEVPNGDISNARELLYVDRDLHAVESLECFRSLQKLDLGRNKLQSVSFLEMNHALKWLSVANNRLKLLQGLHNLSNLVVLNLGGNQLTQLSRGLVGLTALRNLLLHDNQLVTLDGIYPKNHPQLQQLVLSNNKLGPEVSVQGFTTLKKLALSKNELFSFPTLANLPSLSELKLNQNNIMSIPEEVKYLPDLSILDIGNNPLKSVEPLAPLHKLKNLNLKGTPLEEVELGWPRLEVLNFRRVGEKKNKKSAETQWDSAGSKHGGTGKGDRKGDGKGKGGKKGGGAIGSQDGLQKGNGKGRELLTTPEQEPAPAVVESAPTPSVTPASSSTALPHPAAKRNKLDTTLLKTRSDCRASVVVVHGRVPTGEHVAFVSDDEFENIPLTGVRKKKKKRRTLERELKKKSLGAAITRKAEKRKIKCADTSPSVKRKRKCGSTKIPVKKKMKCGDTSVTVKKKKKVKIQKCASEEQK
eukprot:GEMP01037628.1.p1 GENE.GEMP01037628.1~~GEMP01037628.1.p1  ORF type:complete len:485 (+),score=102.20 GEMP01037628.1:15-1469(+)